MDRKPAKTASKSKRRKEKHDPALAVIGAYIRAAREKQDIAQEKFAAGIGIDRAYYGGIERGERNVTIKSLYRIAEGLGKELGDIMPPVSKITRLLTKDED